MKLYDSIIQSTLDMIEGQPAASYDYSEGKAWPDTGVSELVMMRDAAYELGGDNKPAVNFSCVTSNEDFVPKDEIVIIGRDLPEISSSTPFARIALVRIMDVEDATDDDTEPLFRAIQDIDFVKYRVYPKGYMVRTSSENNREQVRISKDAVKQRINFERIGCDYIKAFKKNENILAVKLLFITAPGIDYAKLAGDARNVHDITLTLSKILEGLPTDCASCNLKEICDEVEGMKELHFGKKA